MLTGIRFLKSSKLFTIIALVAVSFVWAILNHHYHRHQKLQIPNSAIAHEQHCENFFKVEKCQEMLENRGYSLKMPKLNEIPKVDFSNVLLTVHYNTPYYQTSSKVSNFLFQVFPNLRSKF